MVARAHGGGLAFLDVEEGALVRMTLGTPEADDGVPHPLPIWPSPSVHPDLVRRLTRHMALDALIETPSAGEHAPAVVLLTPADLAGDTREDCAELFGAAPGRPVLIDAPAHRDLPLDALNVWRVVAVVRSEARIEELGRALRDAHERLELRAALAFDVTRLKEERARLQRKRDEIERRGRASSTPIASRRSRPWLPARRDRATRQIM